MDSRFKNVIGDTLKNTWNNFDLCTANSEGRMVAVNNKFLAASWNVLNGGIAVIDSNAPGSVKPDLPYFRGFRGPVLDLEFSPFRTDLLAATGEDCSVKIFQVPEQGLTTTITQGIQEFAGHVKKVQYLNFNPVASDCLLSGSFDETIKIWSVSKGSEFNSIQAGAIPTSVWWNENGSLVGTCTKDKNVKVFDPRQKKSVLSVVCHDSAKASKLAWMDSNQLVTVGFTKSNAKEAKQWDIRKAGADLATTPVSTTTIDHSSAIATPYFDKESKLLFTLGKGETTIHIFDFNTDKVQKCIDFQSKEPGTAYAAYDRRYVNFNKSEIDRFVKYSKGFLYTVSFRIPRKVDIFDPELYPELSCGQPSQTFDEWAGGETKEPIKKRINEITNDFVSGENNFVKQEEGAGAGSDDKVKALEAKVAELEAKVKQLTEENEGLKKQLESK